MWKPPNLNVINGYKKTNSNAQLAAVSLLKGTIKFKHSEEDLSKDPTAETMARVFSGMTAYLLKE